MNMRRIICAKKSEVDSVCEEIRGGNFRGGLATAWRQFTNAVWLPYGLRTEVLEPESHKIDFWESLNL